MNHDASHCSDYVKGKCPPGCYRAKLTQELRDNPWCFKYKSISWVNFKGTVKCPMTNDVSEN